MKPSTQRDLYMVSVIGLVVSIGLFLYSLIARKASDVWPTCVTLAAVSILWMIIFNPNNKLDSLKPSTKKKIWKTSFFCMIVSFVVFIAAVRYSYMVNTEIICRISICLMLVSGALAGYLRRYKNEWKEDKDSQGKIE